MSGTLPCPLFGATDVTDVAASHKGESAMDCRVYRNGTYIKTAKWWRLKVFLVQSTTPAFLRLCSPDFLNFRFSPEHVGRVSPP